MKHEYTAILNHLRVKHNMTLTQYTQTYIRPGAPGQGGQQDPGTGVMGTSNLPSTDPGIPEDQFYLVYPEQEPVPK